MKRKMKKATGVLLMSIPSLIIIGLTMYEMGLKLTLISTGIVVLITTLVYIGVYLFYTNK